MNTATLWLFFFRETAVSYTLTAAGGSFTVQGTDADLVYHHLAAESGSFTAAGSAADLVYTPIVDGGYVYKPWKQPTVRLYPVPAPRRLVHYTIDARSGRFTTKGNAAQVVLARSLAAQPGHAVVQGGNAALGMRRVLATTPVASIPATQAGFRVGRRMQFGVGRFESEGGHVDQVFDYSLTEQNFEEEWLLLEEVA